MHTLWIEGGRPLRGEVAVAGAKNAAQKMMAAALLTDEEVILRNVPHISDIEVMTSLLHTVGAEVQRLGAHTLRIHAQNVRPARVSIEVAAKIRTSFLVTAPLLARCGRATVPNPGGDRIGHRPVDRLVAGLERFGVQLEYDGAYYNASCNGLRACDYTFPKNSHMGTEHQIIAAVLAQGTSIIRNAAREPEVDDLIAMLNQMGARIRRIEKRTIAVEGVQRLRGTEYTVMPDRIEAGTFAVIAGATRGDIYMRHACPSTMDSLIEKLEDTGCIVQPDSTGIRVSAHGPLKAVDITTQRHPGFMTDWQAPFVVLLTQAEGESTVQETIFPNRLGYTDQLNAMGAKIRLFNPPHETFEHEWNDQDDLPEYFHAAHIEGPTQLHAADLLIPDLRAGATLMIAALCAQGTSRVRGIHWVERGYEHFVERLQALGAAIVEEQAPLQMPA